MNPTPQQQWSETNYFVQEAIQTINVAMNDKYEIRDKVEKLLHEQDIHILGNVQETMQNLPQQLNTMKKNLQKRKHEMIERIRKGKYDHEKYQMEPILNDTLRQLENQPDENVLQNDDITQIRENIEKKFEEGNKLYLLNLPKYQDDQDDQNDHDDQNDQDAEELVQQWQNKTTLRGDIRNILIKVQEEFQNTMHEVQQKMLIIEKETEKNARGQNVQLIKSIQQQAKSIKIQAKCAERRQWDVYYMKIACLAALRSKDPKTPVGACIVDNETYQIVGIGYNSMPYVTGGHNDKLFPWKGRDKGTSEATEYRQDPKLKHAYIVRAAVNAIINRTRESIKGCTLYTTLHPDENCAHAIVLAGIKEVVYCMFTKDKDDERQKQIMVNVSKFFKATKIEEREMTLEGNNTVVTEMNKRIQEESCVNGDPYEAAISWEEFFMGIAILSKTRPGQYDKKRGKAVKSEHNIHQGACIVSPKNQIMAVGYSGYPEQMEHDEIELEEEQQPYITHAEYKAIVGGPKVEGCTLYVTTYPCNVCAKVVIQAGITKVVYYNEGSGEPTYQSSEKILTTCLEEKMKQDNIRSFQFIHKKRKTKEESFIEKLIEDKPSSLHAI